MKLRDLSIVTCLLGAAAMSSGSLMAAEPAVQPSKCPCAMQAEDWNYTAEASQLLKEIQTSARDLTTNAANLESYAHGKLSRHSHAAQLTEAREHINSIGQRLERLQAIRHVAAPWQQRAIDSIVPVAVEVAASTQAAIVHLNESPNHLWAPVYTGHLNSIADRAELMKQTVDVHLELTNTEAKLDELRQRAATLGS